MMKYAVGFIILGAVALGGNAVSAQSYLVGTKSHYQTFKSQLDPHSGYCLDGTHVHNIRLCAKALGSGKTGKSVAANR
jgi:hypothetical protein